MQKLNSKGFGAVEGLLVLVIVILIGVVGWFVYKNHNKKTPVSTTVATTKSNESTESVDSIQSLSGKVLLTLGAKGDALAVQNTIKSFYADYATASAITSATSRHAAVDKVGAKYMTSSMQSMSKFEGHIAGSFNCHQYSPTLVVQNPTVSGSTAIATIQPVDLIDRSAEKTNTITLVKENSVWLIDKLSC